MSSLHCIKSPNQRSLITSLKVEIFTAVRNQAKVQLLTILIYDDLLTSARRLYSNGHNIVGVTQNVCMSMRWKTEQMFYGSCKQPSPRFRHLMPLKPDHSPLRPVYPDQFSTLS
jgi:hypothetical protein